MAALAERDAYAAHLVGLDPPTQLATYLLPPLKRAGVSFGEAWIRALSMVVWPSAEREARDWQKMLAETQHGWRAAYEDRPPLPEELVLAELAGTLRRLTVA
jgi:hypothetical protein